MKQLHLRVGLFPLKRSQFTQHHRSGRWHRLGRFVGGCGLLLASASALAQAPLQFLPKVNFPLSEAEPRDIAVGDFNKDGKLDLVVANSANGTDATGSVDLLLGNGQGGFSSLRTIELGPKAWAVGTGDFNGDGKLDVAVAEGAQDAPLTKV